MVNVGLRAYIWHHKSAEQQVAREVCLRLLPLRLMLAIRLSQLCHFLQLWSLNNSTYHGYREYVR